MTVDTARKRGLLVVSKQGRMRPVDYAVFGLLLGVVLIHVFAFSVIAASNGIAATLHALAGEFGWSWFSNPSGFGETRSFAELVLGVILVVGLGVFWWRIIPNGLAWKRLPELWTRGREYSIPARLPVRVCAAFGWVLLVIMAIYALFTVPQWTVDWSREVILYLLKLMGAELSAPTMERLHDLERNAFLPVLICVEFLRCWAEDRCRRDATRQP